MKRLVLCIVILLFVCFPALGREPKEYDSDVIYDQSKVTHYDLPPLLVTAEGKRITTPDEWKNIRILLLKKHWS